MYLEIVTPEKTLFSGEVVHIKVPGSDGSFGIMKNHAAVISVLQKGILEFTDENEKVQTFEINGGVVEVLDNNIVVLAK